MTDTLDPALEAALPGTPNDVAETLRARADFERWAKDEYPNSNPPSAAWIGWHGARKFYLAAAAPQAEIDRLRDIFAEITAKAQPLTEDATDPEKVTGYRLPVGPLHRAAGKLGFQMFDGEKYLALATGQLRGIKSYLAAHGARPLDPVVFAEYLHEMETKTIPEIEEAISRRLHPETTNGGQNG